MQGSTKLSHAWHITDKNEENSHPERTSENSILTSLRSENLRRFARRLFHRRTYNEITYITKKNIACRRM